MRDLIQATKDADESWAGHDPKAAGRYWAARGALDAACHPSTIDDDALDAVLRALDDERRQTQRRMIAALYWRAGWAKDAAERERPSSQHRTALMRRYLSAREVASDMQIAMEAACAR